MKRMYRQGDVLLLEDGNIDLRKAKRQTNKDRIVLAYGEVTGHSHTMTAETTAGYLFNGLEVIVVDEPTMLLHQEHAPVEVLPGRYFVVHQREYTPSEIRRVVD